MKPLDGLSEYLGAIERRLRLLAVTRGVAASAAAALAGTVLAVLLANYFAFSSPSVLTARVLLFLGLAFAIAGALVVPVMRLNRRRAARAAETKYPQFEERLLTFTERMEQNSGDPFLPLLAADTLEVARQAEPAEVARTAWMFSFSSAAIASALVLLWLGTSGPGFLGYGTSLLWGGLPKGEMKPYYSVQVQPGNKTIRKRADQMITANLMGFNAPKVRFFAKYASASQWQQAEMATQAGGSAYQFLIAGVPESLDYYVEAGGVRSGTYKLNVIDLPSVKKVKVTYHFPAWTGLKDAVEDPGGDLRAVQGTTAEVAIVTDRPLSNGTLMMDDGSKLMLRSGPDNTLVASVPITKDGMYHVASVESGDDVRLSEDYFIEAQKDRPPEVSITRPGRDFRASPIEEVAVAVTAKDDFGLRNVDLHYSVNGGPEKTVSLLAAPGAKVSSGASTIALEDFKVEPGDIVSLYASARGARQTTSTDMFFIEAQPFDKNYSQSQQTGGGGGGEDQDPANQIPERQKEIITATWNQIKGTGAKGTSDAENAAFLSSVQSKLREQAKSLADRMKARRIEAAGDSFKSFVDDMEKAVAAMGPASDKLKGQSWKDALVPEQKALQYLLRAAATFRNIQVAFGQQGGGGGGGQGATRDMEGLFDLELDTEKNQYEGQRQQAGAQSADARQKQVDEALQKLQQLARRQQELADQARRAPQTPEQRYQQEMLRREAEQLQQQLQQMQQNAQLSRSGQSSQQQQGQSGQQSGQQGQQSGQSGQSGQQSGQMSQSGQQQGKQSAQQQMMQQRSQDPRLRNADPQQLQQTIDKLTQALQDMRQAASSQQAGSPQSDAEARRAAERLQEALQGLQGMRSAQAGNQVQELAQRADDLARKQQEFEGQMRRSFGPQNRGGLPHDQAEGLAGQKEAELAELKQLEQDMQNAVRDLMASQRQAATRMRDALAEIQQQDTAREMQRNSEWIRRGMGAYAAISEAQTTAALNQLRDQLQNVQQALGKDGSGKDAKDAAGDKAIADALSRVEQLRRQMEQLQAQQQGAARGRQGQGQLDRNGQGQQLSRNGQQGQQQGGQQQGGQQQGGQQQGGQQAGGQQAGGQQQGGQQSGGQQQGGQQAGGQQQGGQQQGGGPAGGANSPRGGQWNGGNYGGQYGDWYGGNWNPNASWDGRYQGGPIRPEDLQHSYQDAMQSLNQLQQQFRDDPNTQRDIQNAVRDLRQWDPFQNSNDPLLAERIGAALAGVEQVEMELRRKVDDTSGGGNVRSPGSEPVPQGYADAVYEYFRKLSKSKQ